MSNVPEERRATVDDERYRVEQLLQRLDQAKATKAVTALQGDFEEVVSRLDSLRKELMTEQAAKSAALPRRLEEQVQFSGGKATQQSWLERLHLVSSAEESPAKARRQLWLSTEAAMFPAAAASAHHRRKVARWTAAFGGVFAMLAGMASGTATTTTTQRSSVSAAGRDSTSSAAPLSPGSSFAPHASNPIASAPDADVVTVTTTRDPDYTSAGILAGASLASFTISGTMILRRRKPFDDAVRALFAPLERESDNEFAVHLLATDIQALEQLRTTVVGAWRDTAPERKAEGRQPPELPGPELPGPG